MDHLNRPSPIQRFSESHHLVPPAVLGRMGYTTSPTHLPSHDVTRRAHRRPNTREECFTGSGDNYASTNCRRAHQTFSTHGCPLPRPAAFLRPHPQATSSMTKSLAVDLRLVRSLRWKPPLPTLVVLCRLRREGVPVQSALLPPSMASWHGLSSACRVIRRQAGRH
jgi:hypothetical protein